MLPHGWTLPHSSQSTRLSVFQPLPGCTEGTEGERGSFLSHTQGMIPALGVSGNHTAGSRKTSKLCVLVQQPLLTAGGEQLRTDTDRRTALHHTGAVSAALCPTQKELPQGTMRFPFRFSFHLQNASPPQADSREEEALHRCLTLSPAPSTVSPLSAGRSRAPRHSPAAPERCTRAQPLLPANQVLGCCAANSQGPRRVLGMSQLPSTSAAVQRSAKL